jgi:hypothetical protein
VGIRTGNDVLLSAEQVADGFLLDVRKLFVKLVGEGEGYDRETGVVVCAILAFVVLLLALLELEVTLLAVDVANAAVPAL